MTKSLLIALKDIRIRLRDRAGLAFLLITPMLLTVILGLAFGGGNGDESVANFRVPVAVVSYDVGQQIGAAGDFAPAGVELPEGLFDLDLSALGLEGLPGVGDSAIDVGGEGEPIVFGQVLVDVLTSDEMSSILTAELVADEAAARELVSRGERYCCVVVIPEDFSQSLIVAPSFGGIASGASTGEEIDSEEIDSEAANVVIYSDPGSAVGAQVVESIVRQIVSGFATNSMGFDLTISQLFEADQPPSLPQLATVLQNLVDGTAAQIEATGAAGDSAEGSTIGPANSLATVELLDASGDAADFNVLAYFAPSMAILFVALSALQGVRTILQELRNGTFDRLNVTPTRPRAILLGKILGTFSASALQFGVLLLASTLLFRLVWGDPLGVVLLALLIVLVFTSLGLLIAVVARSESQATTISTFVVMVFAAVGGNFLPAANFPSWMQSISRWTPNYWSVNGFLKLAEGQGLTALAPEFAALAGMATFFFVAGLWLYQQRFV